MNRLLLGTVFAVALAAWSNAPASAKTVKECNAEYAANKAAIKGNQKKADFITACKAGTEVIPGAAASPPAPAPAQTAAPAPAPAAPAPAPQVSAPVSKPMARAAKPMAPTAGTATGANQFSTEAQATGHCPGATVVWVNTKSDIYHFAGTKSYGTTKAGAYMCETDATAAGDRASKTEKHP